LQLDNCTDRCGWFSVSALSSHCFQCKLLSRSRSLLGATAEALLASEAHKASQCLSPFGRALQIHMLDILIYAHR